MACGENILSIIQNLETFRDRSFINTGIQKPDTYRRTLEFDLVLVRIKHSLPTRQVLYD